MQEQADVDPRFELKIDPGRALPEAIADKLRQLVEEGEYKPGGRLPNEAELARKLKVARSSVRTALQRLEAMRILEVRRGRGWYVRRAPAESSGPLDARDYQVSDLFELRIGLEGLAASLAAVRITEGELEDLAKINKQHQEADDREEMLRTDVAFHEAIVRAARNTALERTYQGIIGELADWRFQSFAAPGVGRRSAREHSKVLRYLRNHDPGGARVAMNGHLQRLYDELPEIGAEPLDTTESVVDLDPEWRD
ncbi:FadR/GntR family transcriptional regulator [Pseudonocardia eucalypti]|uniref:FadR/GntR family transcriptional regulator n=1 Tax=Pseudonocardia eucalypti TaxID=648755 RepID=A0ABP9R039_9PSEU|nr:DNA-binding FadR family transcriptional regulator [Pseudonocardia eucalypti]